MQNILGSFISIVAQNITQNYRVSEKENHILAVYTNKDKELDNNEASLLIINEQGTSNNEVQRKNAQEIQYDL